LIISLLFDISNESNAFLDSLNLKDMLADPEIQNKEVNDLNLNDLLNGSLESKFKDNYHVRYEGSLTYSPCTEGVTWIILLEKFKNLSSLQVEDLKMLVNNKNTPRAT
jgi:carbonic anhydrase